MKWPRLPFTRPRPTGRPQPSGWCQRNHGCLYPNWYEIDGALVRQCDCGHVSRVIPQHLRWITALQPTDDREAEDWGPGFLD